MDNSFMVGLSAQRVLRHRMDATANNLANMTTTGFKAERLVMRPLSERPATASDAPKEVAFVDAWRLQRDFAAGPIQHTGNPLDAALDGPGFFVVQTPDGQAFTRDGRFTLGPDGVLVTRQGHPVLSGGGPMALDPAGGEVVIGPNGMISQEGIDVGRLDVMDFDLPDALEHLGDNLWRGTDQPPRPAEGFRVVGGSLEGSNVNAISEISQMIEISRVYESVSKMIVQSDDLRGASIEKLARVG